MLQQCGFHRYCTGILLVLLACLLQCNWNQYEFSVSAFHAVTTTHNHQRNIVNTSPVLKFDTLQQSTDRRSNKVKKTRPRVILFSTQLSSNINGVANPEELQKFVEQAGDRLVVVDLRNPDAEIEPLDQATFQVGPLPNKDETIRPNAINLIWDRTKASMDIPSSLLEDKTTPIITHCGAGGRGTMAKEYLEQQYGFTNVINGGGPKDLDNWKVFGEK
jgi:rhodanese-related sulfurtransferase